MRSRRPPKKRIRQGPTCRHLGGGLSPRKRAPLCSAAALAVLRVVRHPVCLGIVANVVFQRRTEPRQKRLARRCNRRSSAASPVFAMVPAVGHTRVEAERERLPARPVRRLAPLAPNSLVTTRGSKGQVIIRASMGREIAQLGGLKVRWFDPIAHVSELPDHSRSVLIGIGFAGLDCSHFVGLISCGRYAMRVMGVGYCWKRLT